METNFHNILGHKYMIEMNFCNFFIIKKQSMQRERLDPFLDKKYITCVFFFSKRQGLFNKKKKKKERKQV